MLTALKTNWPPANLLVNLHRAIPEDRRENYTPKCLECEHVPFSMGPKRREIFAQPCTRKTNETTFPSPQVVATLELIPIYNFPNPAKRNENKSKKETKMKINKNMLLGLRKFTDSRR